MPLYVVGAALYVVGVIRREMKMFLVLLYPSHDRTFPNISRLEVQSCSFQRGIILWLAELAFGYFIDSQISSRVRIGLIVARNCVL